MINGYLAVAYAFVCGIFLVYAWILYGRRKRLEREMDALKDDSRQQGGEKLRSQN